MLRRERQERAGRARTHFPLHPGEIFYEQEYITQLALDSVGVTEGCRPSEAAKVGKLLMNTELLANLRIPYATEVLGMPGAGKTTMINRYLRELWHRKQRHLVSFVDEGARTIRDDYEGLRESDPFLYSMLSGTRNYMDYVFSIDDVNAGMRMAVADRGQMDRRVFRRMLFTRGLVKPSIIENENDFQFALEQTPMQMCGVIMMMTRPEVSIRRIGKTGPVVNMEVLPLLYEQYWRVHHEILQGDCPYRVYTCIDAEATEEEVYERFRYAMDTALNIHNIFLAALARAFPSEFDRAKAAYDRGERVESVAEKILGSRLGGRALIVGGDTMKSKEDILQKPVIEAHIIRRPGEAGATFRRARRF